MKPPRPLPRLVTPGSEDKTQAGVETNAGPISTMAPASPPDEHPEDARADDVQPGDVIAGKYTLVSRLVEGGMGSLWVAHNSLLDVDVALKLIRADIKHLSDQLADRLLTEARASAKLGHPAIARTLDYGKTERGDPYIVMELLQGEDLRTELERRGRVSPKKSVRLLLPIAHALAVALEKEIVHRDIKPENIFLSRNEDGSIQPKVIDFGIAKLKTTKVHERITQIGAMVGSPGYMSPEQARGDDCEHLADLWSFCVVLYEMVTGRLPFEGKNFHALLRSIIEDAVPPITGYNVGDEELWKILDRGLRKDPEQRWPTMRALGRALARWAISRGVTEDVCGASLDAVWLAYATSNEDAWSSMPPRAMDPDDRPSGRRGLNSPFLDATDPPDPLPAMPVTIQPTPADGRVSSVEAEVSRASLAGPPPRRMAPIIAAVALVLTLLGGFAIYRMTAAPSFSPPVGTHAPETSADTARGPDTSEAKPVPSQTAPADRVDDAPTPSATAAATATAKAPAKQGVPAWTAKPRGATTAAPPPVPATTPTATLKRPDF